jgi:hypothetical protein
MTDAKQLDLMVHQAEKILDDLIDESADAAEIAGAFRAFIAGVKNIKPDTNVGATGQTCPVRRYKLVYNYSAVEIEVSGTLAEAEAVISAEYAALKRMSDGPAALQAPDDGWGMQEPPLDGYVDDGYVGQRSPSRHPQSYGQKKPLTDGERRYATSLGMKGAWDPDVDPSQVRSWIGSHKGRR